MSGLRRSERPRENLRFKTYHSDRDFPPGPFTAPLGSPRETRSHVGRLERDQDRDRESYRDHERPKPRLNGSASTISSHYPSSRHRKDSFEHVHRHPRTRSLSMSRPPFSPPPSDDEASPQDSDEERHRQKPARHTLKAKTREREHYTSGSRPSLKYYQNDLASVSSPRLAEWPTASSSRPPSRSPEPVRPKRMDREVRNRDHRDHRELRRDVIDRASSFQQISDDRESLFSTPSEPDLRARINIRKENDRVGSPLQSPRKHSSLARSMSGTGTFGDYEGRQGGLSLRKPGTSSRAPSVAPS